MFGFVVIEVMTLSGHLSIINEMSVSMYEDKCSQGNDTSVLIIEEIVISLQI